MAVLPYVSMLPRLQPLKAISHSALEITANQGKAITSEAEGYKRAAYDHRQYGS
mgnify:CR=1 FL=1